jgi:hypothetical protein
MATLPSNGANSLNGRLNGGRPTKLTKTLAKRLCSVIARSPASIKRLCQDNNLFPDYEQLWDWRRKYPWFDECLYQARTQQSDLLVEQTVDVTHDLVAKPKLDMAQVQAAKLLVENSRWIGSKLQRRVYGDDPQVQVQQQTQVTVPAEVLTDLRTRLDAAREPVQDLGKDKNSTVCREGARAELEPGPKTLL